MEKLYKLFKFFVFPLVWILNCFPKNRRVIVFGSQFGKKYSDNSKYFYEYCLGRDDFSVYWITKSISCYGYLKEKGFPVLYAWSFKGVYYSIRAQYTVISYSRLTDLPFYISQDVCFQLWHGTPFKKIRYDTESSVARRGVFSNVSKFFYQGFFERHDYVVSSGQVSFDIFKSALYSRSRIFKVLEFGYPRNDVFFKSVKKNNDAKKIALYMPTFRGGNKLDPLLSSMDDLGALVSICSANGFNLFIKAHPNTKGALDASKIPKGVNFCDPDGDPQDVLRISDVLITDYSSCMFDFLLTNRPIILYWPDFELYSKTTGFYNDVLNEVIGLGLPVASDFLSLESYVSQITSFVVPEKGFDHRRVFNKFDDGNNCARLYDYILSDALK